MSHFLRPDRNRTARLAYTGICLSLLLVSFLLCATVLRNDPGLAMTPAAAANAAPVRPTYFSSSQWKADARSAVAAARYILIDSEMAAPKLVAQTNRPPVSNSVPALRTTLIETNTPVIPTV